MYSHSTFFLNFSVKSFILSNGVIPKQINSISRQDTAASLSDSESGLHYELDDIEESLRLVEGEVIEELDENIDKEASEHELSESIGSWHSADAELSSFALKGEKIHLLDKTKEEISAAVDRTSGEDIVHPDERTLSQDRVHVDDIQPVFSSGESAISFLANDNDSDENDDNSVDESQVLIKTEDTRGSEGNLGKKKSSDDNVIDVWMYELNKKVGQQGSLVWNY